MKHFSYYIIGGEILLVSLLLCIYYQSQTINKQRESIKELTSKYYKFEEYKEVIKLADIIFDNNNINILQKKIKDLKSMGILL